MSGVEPLHQSEVTASELLTRLLELIMNCTSVADLTVDRVGPALGIPLATHAPGKWGGRARLTPDWSYAITALGDRIRLGFFDNQGGTAGAMGSICQPDFDDFTGALRNAGFAKAAFYGEHGELVYDSYTREQLRVDVTPRGESGAASDTILHECVQAVTVR